MFSVLTKLKNLMLTSVDLVRRGANQEADIRLCKSADDQEETLQVMDTQTALFYTDALAKSIHSIQADGGLDDDQKVQMIQKSLEQFNAAVEKYASEEPVSEEPEEPVVEKSAAEYETIMEISAI